MFQRKWSIKPCVVVVLTMSNEYSCRYCAQDADDDDYYYYSCAQDADDDDDDYYSCAQDAHLVWEQDAVGGIPVVRLPVGSSKRPSL